MSDREITRDKARVLAFLQEAPKFMPYLHHSRGAHEVVKLLGSTARAQRALVALVQDRKICYLENCSPDHYQAFAHIPPPPSDDLVEVNPFHPWPALAAIPEETPR